MFKATWEQFFERAIRDIFQPGARILDVGAGLRIDASRGNREDPSRAWIKPLVAKTTYLVLDPVPTYHPDIVGDVMALPMGDEEFDSVICLAVLEHLPRPWIAVQEMYRVLKPQGRVLILEFSLPGNNILRLGHHFYLRWVVPYIGFLLSGNYAAYRYLSKTIETFPYGDRFCKIIAQVGFKNVKTHPLLGGVATIYQGDK